MSFIDKMLHKLFGIYYVPDVSADNKQAIRDLQNMSDKELQDIGVNRFNIKTQVLGDGRND